MSENQLMTKREYVNACERRCRECGCIKYNRSMATNRVLVKCEKPNPCLISFDSLDGWTGIEEFFMNQENWKQTCPYADERLMMLFNTEEFQKPLGHRKIRI